MKNTRLSTKLGGYKHYWLQKTEQNRPFWATSKNQTAVLVRQIELNDIPYLKKHNLKGGFVRKDKQSQALCICDEHYSDDIKSNDWKLLKTVL